MTGGLAMGASKAGSGDALGFDFHGDEIVPRYFLEPDHGWLRALVDEYLRYEGKPRADLSERLAEPLPMRVPLDKLRVARKVLDRMWDFAVEAEVKPAKARATLFELAAAEADDERAIAEAAAQLEVSGEVLQRSLFADLADERIVRAPNPMPSVASLAQRANLALVTGLLKRALAVRIEGGSALRAVVRQAKLRGLLCTVHPEGSTLAPARDRLQISGPFALFRRTVMYGRALATLVPFAARCADLEMRSICDLGSEGPRNLVIRAGDPLFPAPSEERFDSKLERRFFRELAEVAPDWDVLREPKAVPADGTLVFPDFELVHRLDVSRRWLVEIAGFWTPEYVADKLARLREADMDRFILCLDAERNCSSEELPERARVIRYRRRIDPAEVLAIIEA